MDNNITTFICIICHLQFGSINLLHNHINTSEKCKNKHPCHRCGKIFSKKYDLNRHLARKNPCKEITNDNINVINTVINNVLTADMIQLRREEMENELKRDEIQAQLRREEMENELKRDEIQAQLRRDEIAASLEEEKIKTIRKQISSRTTININNGTVNNIYNTVNYTVSPLEVINAIDEEIAKKIIESDQPYVTNIIKYLHSNPDYPMHINIVSVDEKSGTYEVYLNKEWVQKQFNAIKDVVFNDIKLVHKKLINVYIELCSEEELKNKRIDFYMSPASALNNGSDEYEIQFYKAILSKIYYLYISNKSWLNIESSNKTINNVN